MNATRSDRAYQNTRRIAAQPDWAWGHRELRRKGVTLSLLWEEYRANYPEGYGYSRFTALHKRIAEAAMCGFIRHRRVQAQPAKHHEIQPHLQGSLVNRHAKVTHLGGL
ncbi:transposase [Roseovarius sp. MBR-78]